MKMSIRDSATVCASKDQIFTDLDEETIVLNLKEGVYYGLSGVGGRVWRLLRRPCRVSEVIQELARHYEVKAGRCRQDLIPFLRKLAAQGLIEVTNTDSA